MMNPDLQHLLHATARSFADRFGRPPRFAAAAPGRVNLIGEHTDYNDGYVLPMAIDRWVVVVADTGGATSTLWAADLDESVTVDLTAALSPLDGGGFGNYLLGVADQLAAVAALPNLDVALAGTVPTGAGLASSAAVEVAFATLLEQVTGIDLGPQELAAACLRAEHAFPGTPCGIMDMLTATHARAGHALLIDCRSLRVRPIAMPRADPVAVLVADTGIRHDLAQGAYAERRQRCEDAARGLGLGSLRDADLGLLAGSPLQGPVRRAARHVISENERTLLAAGALATGGLDTLGELMFDSHASLRDLLEVSCPELDAVIEAAASLGGAGGVIGARLTGAGFGGCAVILCHADAAARIAAELRQRYAERFGNLNCSLVRAAGPACPLDLPSSPLG